MEKIWHAQRFSRWGCIIQFFIVTNFDPKTSLFFHLEAFFEETYFAFEKSFLQVIDQNLRALFHYPAPCARN